MKKIFKLILGLFISFCFINLSVNANNLNQELIRVGISNNDFSSYLFDCIELTSEKDLLLIDKNTNEIIENIDKNFTLIVKKEDNKFQAFVKDNCNCQYKQINLINEKSDLIIKPAKANTLIQVVGLKRVGKQAAYRGEIELVTSSKDSSKFCVVNILDIQSYLKGVIPNEMPIEFGLEALKAQTVAARNYALKPRVKYYTEYDICDSVACQVYFGANTEKELSNKAVDLTLNNVALYNEELILALYSSTAGGHTENYENAFSEEDLFPATPIPYLKGVPDMEDVKLTTEEDISNFYKNSPPAFDNSSPYFRWKINWEKTELEKILEKNIFTSKYQKFITPLYNNYQDFGKLKDIQVLKRGVSGKIMALKVITDKNEFIIQKELVIRQIFKKLNRILPSANVIFDIERTDKGEIKTIHAIGGGYGHGVGMSQFGAGQMSKLGISYDKILKHYYSDILLSTVPVFIDKSKGITQVTQEFYAPYKQANLFIHNLNKPSNLVVTINDISLVFNFRGIHSDKVYANLTPYIKQGKNKITYAFSDVVMEDNKRVKFFVELKGIQDNDSIE